MASIPFLPPFPKRREPLTGSQRIIVISAIGFLIFLVWAMLAKVDEVTAGQGKAAAGCGMPYALLRPGAALIRISICLSVGLI